MKKSKFLFTKLLLEFVRILEEAKVLEKLTVEVVRIKKVTNV